MNNIKQFDMIKYGKTSIPNGMHLLVGRNMICSSRIPFGMHLSVECNDDPQYPHPVRDASPKGCKRGISWQLLPKDAFPTECQNPYYRILSEIHLSVGQHMTYSARIPFGMHLSVECNDDPQYPHPVRDCANHYKPSISRTLVYNN